MRKIFHRNAAPEDKHAQFGNYRKNEMQTVFDGYIVQTGQEIVTRNEQFIRMDPNLFPQPKAISEAFSYNFSTGLQVYYITSKQLNENINGQKYTSATFKN